jgi:hypothetical protein
METITMHSRTHDLKPDPNGRYRPYLGWKEGLDGERRQHRFNLGSDKREAESRFALLRSLWEQNCERYGDLWEPLILRTRPTRTLPRFYIEGFVIS